MGITSPSAGAHFFVQCDLIVMPETAEELSRQPDVRKEIVSATGQKKTEKVRAATKDKFWFCTFVWLIIGCAFLYFLLTAKLIPLPKQHIDLAGRLLRAVALI